MNIRGLFLTFIIYIAAVSSVSAQNETGRNEVDTTLNEYEKYQLFSPLTYSRNAVNKAFDFDSETDADNGASNMVTKALLSAYLNRPDLVKTTTEKLADAASVEPVVAKKPVDQKPVIVDDKIDVIDDIEPDIVQPLVVKKPNFWTIKGDYYLQFMQNYISSNWYKGGESSYSFVASGVIEANYNNKSKLSWDNKLEAKIGFQTTRGDTLHTFKTSEDLLRYTGKVGLQATKKWKYTLQLLAYTQFTAGYKANDPMVYSDFCSPLNLNLSIGMQYTIDLFKGKLKGTALISPLAYNYKYVGRLNLSERNGIDADRHHKEDFGSSVTADVTWQFLSNLKWKSRFYGFTSYKRVQLEWENTLTFSFNKYISTNLFLYPRFDDDVKVKDNDFGYFQLKEYASLGFAYNF